MKLNLCHRLPVERFFITNRFDSFYHYFPLIYAISESTSPIEFVEDNLLEIDRSTLLFERGAFEIIPDRYTKVLISQNKPVAPFLFEPYDHNFIYDLARTVAIKNFRGNVQDFLKLHPTARYVPVTKDNEDDALEVVEYWYSKSKRKEFHDLGYTMWLVENYKVFGDLQPRLVYVDCNPVAYTLFAKLRSDLAIHLICKDTGLPYLQDYTRMMTYREMITQGFVSVNDGSSVGEEGIYHYKLKLRPTLIYPIFSWVR